MGQYSLTVLSIDGVNGYLSSDLGSTPRAIAMGVGSKSNAIDALDALLSSRRIHIDFDSF